MQTFNYSSNSALKDNLTTIVLSIVTIVVPIVYPFGVRIGRLRVLEPLPTTIILVTVGVVLLYRVITNIRKARALAAKKCFITVEDDTVSYPVVKHGKAQQCTFKISEITDVHYDNEDGILTVKLTDGNKARFDVEFFDNPDKLNEFAALIQK